LFRARKKRGPPSSQFEAGGGGELGKKRSLLATPTRKNNLSVHGRIGKKKKNLPLADFLEEGY